MRRYLFAGVLPTLLAAVVLAAPAAASASPKLEYAAGGAVPLGAPIKASSTNLTLTSSSGNYFCAQSTLEGKLSANSGSAIVDEVETTSFYGSTGVGSKCQTTLPGGYSFTLEFSGMPVCLSSTTLGSSTLRPCGSGSLEIPLHLYYYNVLIASCTYAVAREVGQLEATYAGSSPLLFTLKGGQQIYRKTGTMLCPAEFTPSGYFTVTSGGSQLKVS